MKWLLDLIWPKAPVTMEEVGSSRADVPVENLKPPAWKPDSVLPPGLVLGPSDTMTVIVGPTVPEVDSLLRQVVSLREEVARVKVEAMGAITEARYENARYHADERGGRDALRSGLLELKALVEPMRVECRRQSVEQLRIADRIERMENTDGALVKSVIEHCHRLERVEASFPAGWSTSAWYTKKVNGVWLNVSDRRTGWYVSVHSAHEYLSGCLESGPHETMGEAIESAERLGKQLCVEMEDRTVIAGAVVKQQCSQVDGGKRVGIA